MLVLRWRILALRRVALTVPFNQMTPDASAALERVAETIAVALPRDALSALATCRFFDERHCVDCPMERSEGHTSELQSLMRNPYAVICLKKQHQSYTENTTYS